MKDGATRSIAEIVALAEARFLIRVSPIVRERDAAVAAVWAQPGITLSAAAYRVLELEEEYLRKSVHLRLDIYSGVATEFGVPGSRSETALRELRQQVERMIAAGCAGTRGDIERRAAASGAAGPVPALLRYDAIRSGLQDELNDRIRAMQLEASLASQAEVGDSSKRLRESRSSAVLTSAQKRKPRGKSEQHQKLIAQVKKLRGEGCTHQEICRRFDDFPRPEQAKWRHLPWRMAFNQHRSAVKKWISNALKS